MKYFEFIQDIVCVCTNDDGTTTLDKLVDREELSLLLNN